MPKVKKEETIDEEEGEVEELVESEENEEELLKKRLEDIQNSKQKEKFLQSAQKRLEAVEKGVQENRSYLIKMMKQIRRTQDDIVTLVNPQK